MKKTLIGFFAALAILGAANGANATQISATLTDDTDYSSGSGFHPYDQYIWVGNYPTSIKPEWWQDQWYDGTYPGVMSKAYLKFKLPEITDPYSIKSASLKAYSQTTTDTSTMRAYVINYDNWSEANPDSVPSQSLSDFYVTSTKTHLNDGIDQYEWTYNFEDLTPTQIQYLLNAGNNGYLTIALYGNQNPFTDEDILSKEYGNFPLAYDDEPADDPDNLLWQQYVVGTNGKYTPSLTFETTTPAPEPASMLLGLMSLGGVFGLRRNKK